MITDNTATLNQQRPVKKAAGWKNDSFFHPAFILRRMERILFFNSIAKQKVKIRKNVNEYS